MFYSFRSATLLHIGRVQTDREKDAENRKMTFRLHFQGKFGGGQAYTVNLITSLQSYRHQIEVFFRYYMFDVPVDSLAVSIAYLPICCFIAVFVDFNWKPARVVLSSGELPTSCGLLWVEAGFEGDWAPALPTNAWRRLANYWAGQNLRKLHRRRMSLRWTQEPRRGVPA